MSLRRIFTKLVGRTEDLRKLNDKIYNLNLHQAEKRIYVANWYLNLTGSVSIVNQKLRIMGQIMFDRRQICLFC